MLEADTETGRYCHSRHTAHNARHSTVNFALVVRFA